jgi:branched-chain amino acid transport system substrate-binding protein
MRRHSAIQRGIALAIAATAAMSLAACGQSGQSGGGSGGGDIPIGLVYPTSGVWKTQGQNSLNGAKLAIKDINAAGGVLGRKLVGELADAGNDPTTAASAARQVLRKGKLPAMIGSYLSSYTLTVSTVAEQAKVPILTQSFSDELITRGYKYTYKTTPTAADFSKAGFSYLVDMYKAAGKPLPTAAVIASDDASGQQQYDAAVKAAPSSGMSIVLKEQFPANITDTSSLVSQIVAANPGILLLNGPDLAEIQIVKALRGRGADMPIVGLGGAGVTTQAFIDALGDGVNGVLATVAYNGDVSSQAKAVTARYLKEYGGTFMPAEAGTAYVNVYLIADAIKKAKSTDPAKVSAALHKLDLTGDTAKLYPGGEIKFDDRGLNIKTYPLMIQYQNGNPVTVWPKKDAVGTPQL